MFPLNIRHLFQLHAPSSASTGAFDPWVIRPWPFLLQPLHYISIWGTRKGNILFVQMYCAKYTCTSREISYLKVTEHWFLTFKQSFLFSVRFSTTVRLYLIWLCVKKTNLNRKDRDKDVGHQTAWSAIKKEVFINDPLPPIQGQQMPVSRIFFISKPDQPERMAGDMKCKAFVLPEVISATNDIFTLCKVQIRGQPEVVETENAECAIFLK